MQSADDLRRENEALRRRIARTEADLERLERLRAELLGAVGHELRVPLTAIKGSAATVLGAAAALDPAEMLQFFRIIDEQADHLGSLIADLLARAAPTPPAAGEVRGGAGGGGGGARGGGGGARGGGDRGGAPAGSRDGRHQTPVLVVDDDPQTLGYVCDALSAAGYAPLAADDPAKLPELVRAKKPRLVLLDPARPGADGIEPMQRIRGLADVPVIFISGYGRDETITQALEQGAADYIVKPFSPTELTARVQAALRRLAERVPYRAGDLAIDYEQRRATVAGRRVDLTAIEYELLRVLSTGEGRVSTVDALLRQVWGGRRAGDPKLLRALRQAAPPQAGRRRGPPRLHLHRARGRLPHGRAPRPGRRSLIHEHGPARHVHFLRAYRVVWEAGVSWSLAASPSGRPPARWFTVRSGIVSAMRFSPSWIILVILPP